MRRLWKEIWVSMLLGLVLPGVLLNMTVLLAEGKDSPTPQETQPPPEDGLMVHVFTGEVLQEQRMDDYLTGVLLAEMPASFEAEALKAQSVAARTYARKVCTGGAKHGGGVCGEPGCCQAYLSEEEYLSRGGRQEDLEKIRQAVAATSGYVLTYEGVLIEATYFSCSGGYTEDAVAVWGTDYPYLQAVPSPGEEEAAYYMESLTFTPGQFLLALGRQVEGNPQNWFGQTLYTEGGGVDTMEIGGISYTGTQLRKLLGLRSTAFTVSVGEVGITITTRGYGHRVGMSQYGADAMAVAGSTWQEILAHYYPGTELQMLQP